MVCFYEWSHIFARVFMSAQYSKNNSDVATSIEKGKRRGKGGSRGHDEPSQLLVLLFDKDHPKPQM